MRWSAYSPAYCVVSVGVEPVDCIIERVPVLGLHRRGNCSALWGAVRGVLEQFATAVLHRFSHFAGGLGILPYSAGQRAGAVQLESVDMTHSDVVMRRVDDHHVLGVAGHVFVEEFSGHKDVSRHVWIVDIPGGVRLTSKPYRLDEHTGSSDVLKSYCGAWRSLRYSSDIEHPVHETVAVPLPCADGHAEGYQRRYGCQTICDIQRFFNHDSSFLRHLRRLVFCAIPSLRIRGKEPLFNRSTDGGFADDCVCGSL